MQRELIQKIQVRIISVVITIVMLSLETCHAAAET